MKTCSIEGCGGRHDAKGFCKLHYYRNLRYGDPLLGGPKRGEPMEWLKKIIVNPPAECAIWPYGKTSAGYGTVYTGGGKCYAHRLSLQLFTGEIGAGLEAAHGPCHNPSCVNPLHLSWKTRQENDSDKKRDGTKNNGENHYRSKITTDQALAIKQDKRLYREISTDYGIGEPTICAIKKGLSWKHLP